MFYVNKPWSKVLEEVAEQSGYQLVMHDVPQGNLNRKDFKKHSPKEAIWILNQELEPEGYRILVTGEYMTVIGIERSRVEYPRREFAANTNRVAETQPAAVVQAPAQTIAAAKVEVPSPEPAEGTRTPYSRTRQVATPALQPVPEQRSPRRDALVQQVQFADPQTADQPAVQTVPSQAAEESAAPAPVVSRKITPKQRTASEIARQLHSAFQRRAQVIDMGSHGLPAIRVAPPPMEESLLGDDASPKPAPTGPTFVLELDVANNVLWLEATEETANSLERLILLLDRTVVQPGESEKLIAGDGTTTDAAQKLQPELEKLQQMRRQDGIDPLPDTANSPEGDINLKGDVYLEAMADLDLLIIRGNAKDVEKVRRMIQQIEEMAVGTAPEIHVLKLQYVNSESLAELLSDVYERLTDIQTRGTSQARKSVDIVAVSRPNAILIMAPETVMPSILELAKELDQEIDPTSEVQIFALHNAVATQVVTVIDDFFEERQGLGSRVKVTADIRTNSVIVQAKPGELAEVSMIIKKMDRPDSASQVEMKSVQLQHAAADELATFLTTAIQSVLNPAQTGTTGNNLGGGGGGFGGTQGSQELRESRAVVLEFLTQEGNAERLLRSGLLSDIRINGDIRTNTLLITAPKQSMPLLTELVRILDQPSAAVADIKVFTLKNADAESVVDALTQLFTTQTNQQQSQQQMGIQIAGATDSSSSLVPLRFQADVRTNTVIAVGGGDALRMVEAVIYRLDQPDVRNRQKTVIKLRNTLASDVASAITQFLQSERDLYTIDQNRISTSQLLEQEVIVTPEDSTNNLLISATPKYFEIIKNLAEQLDKEPSQVMIQALIVEVQLNDNDEFGVELGFQDSVLFNRGLVDSVQTLTQTTTAPNGVQTTTQQILSQSSTPGFPFNNLPLGNNTAVSPATIGTQGLSSFGLGRTSSDLGFGGLVLSASSQNVNVLIRALAARRNVRVLSRPQVLTMDNQVAQIQVGQSVPILQGVTQTAGSSTNNVVYNDAGIILTVAPRISPEGQIVMEVTAEKSDFSGGVGFVTNSANGQTTTVNSPIKNVTTANTTVKVPDSQTIVVGGMITESTDTNDRKVPWLGDLPWVGNVFRYDATIHTRTELLIFLTPRIIHVDTDMEFLKQVETGRIQFMQDEAEAMHGPIFGLPEPQFYDATGNFGTGIHGNMTLPPTPELQEAPVPVDNPLTSP